MSEGNVLETTVGTSTHTHTKKIFSTFSIIYKAVNT